MSPRHSDPRTRWNEELRPTADCVPIERFDSELTSAERDHVASCARCEAELALWQACADETPSPGEGAAVQWIAAEVGRRRSSAVQGRAESIWAQWRAAFGPRRLAAAAAAVVLLSSAVYLARDPEPALGPPSSSDVYRSTALDVLAPTGDLREAPAVLHWKAASGAATYDVEVLEVDRTVLWRTTSTETSVALPPSLVAKFAPGKTVLWEVKARAADSTVLADSGTQRFRVAPGGAGRER